MVILVVKSDSCVLTAMRTSGAENVDLKSLLSNAETWGRVSGMRMWLCSDAIRSGESEVRWWYIDEEDVVE